MSNIKNRLNKLETSSKAKNPLKILFIFPGEQLDAAKIAKGWQHIPDNQLKVVRITEI